MAVKFNRLVEVVKVAYMLVQNFIKLCRGSWVTVVAEIKTSRRCRKQHRFRFHGQ